MGIFKLTSKNVRGHIGGQNALGGIFTDIANTWPCVISVVNPPKTTFVAGAFYATLAPLTVYCTMSA